MNFILRCIGIMIAVAVAVWIVPGVDFSSSGNGALGFLILAIIIALLNMSIKPILQILSAPITLISLGVFYFVINTALLYLAGAIGNGLFDIGFTITNFASGFIASLIISFVSSIINGILDTN